MTRTTPPRLPASKQSRQIRRRKFLIVTTVVLAAPLALIVLSAALGLIRAFSFPTGGMGPAISAGDHVIMERFSFLGREPRRGDIVVFKTDGLPSVPPGELYAKRVAGEPGDHLQIADGKLYINDRHVALSNAPEPTPGFVLFVYENTGTTSAWLNLSAGDANGRADELKCASPFNFR